MAEENEFTTIRIDVDTKKKLDFHKVHEREPYGDVLKRLLEKLKE